MSNPNMPNLSPKLGSDPPTTSPNQQPNLAHRQPDFAHSQTNFPPNQPNLARRQVTFAQSPPNVPLNMVRHQPSFAHSQPNIPHNQPNPAQRQPSSFAHCGQQPNVPHNQPNLPSSPDFPHGQQQQQQQQQQHFSPANQIALPGHPHFLDQSQFSTPTQPLFPNSANSHYFPASSHQSFSPSSHPRFFAQASRPAHSNHPHFSNQRHQQQQQHHSRTSSQESILTYNPSPIMRAPQFVQAGGANRRVTISTSAADAARRQEAMQTNFTPAAANDGGGPSSFIGPREVHNAISQVHDTLNVIRNEMLVMHQQVDQNIYALHHDMYGGIERVIKMLNYSERNNLARTVNSTITSQTQLLEPLLTSDGVRPEDFPANTLALNSLDIHQVTALCELYSLGLSGGMEQKMQRLRMFIGIERA